MTLLVMALMYVYYCLVVSAEIECVALEHDDQLCTVVWGTSVIHLRHNLAIQLLGTSGR
jgi:hypothetical protein